MMPRVAIPAAFASLVLCASAALADSGAPSTAVIPPGDVLGVALLANISSSGSREGDAFAVITLQDYYVRGQLVLPKGSPGYGVVTKAKRPGAFHSNGELSFVVTRLIAPDETPISVETNPATIGAAMSNQQSSADGPLASLLPGSGKLAQTALSKAAGLLSRGGHDVVINRGAIFNVTTVETLDVPCVAYGTQPARFDPIVIAQQLYPH